MVLASELFILASKRLEKTCEEGNLGNFLIFFPTLKLQSTDANAAAIVRAKSLVYNSIKVLMETYPCQHFFCVCCVVVLICTLLYLHP